MGVVDELIVHEKVGEPLPPVGIKTNGADNPPPIHIVSFASGCRLSGVNKFTVKVFVAVQAPKLETAFIV